MIGLIAVLVLADLAAWGICLCTNVTRLDRMVAGRCASKPEHDDDE